MTDTPSPTTPATFTASVPTEKASRYMQQLCKHWAHKFPVDFDTERGTVTFPTAQLAMEVGPTALALTLTPSGAEEIAGLKEVVERHLDRFAFREGELVYDWKEVTE